MGVLFAITPLVLTLTLSLLVICMHGRYEHRALLFSLLPRAAINKLRDNLDMLALSDDSKTVQMFEQGRCRHANQWTRSRSFQISEGL